MQLKMVTFPPLVLVLFLALGNGQGQPYYPNLINEGFNTLSRGNRQDMTTTIRLWYKQVRDYDRDGVASFSLARLLKIYGEPEDLLRTCQDYAGIFVDGLILMEKGKEHCGLVRQFQKQIDEMNSHIDRIDSDYKYLTGNHNGISSNYRETAVDDFYQFVANSCGNATDTSGCFFHEVAGNEFKLIRGKIPFHPTRSIHQEVYLSYLKITLALLKGYAAEVARLRRGSFNPTADTRIEKLQTLFVLRAANLARLALSALKIAPRDIMPKDPLEYIEGVNYIRLKWFVEQIIANEANLNEDASCWKSCDYYEKTEFRRDAAIPARGNEVCLGTVHNCYQQSLGTLCPATKYTARRYGGIKGITGNWQNNLIVNQSLCANETKRTDDIYFVQPSLLVRCDVCTCLCDDFRNPETVRTFSLRNATSAIEFNMVITGMRFKELGGVIHLQIQQARLIRLGVIDVTSRQWVPVQNVNSSQETNGDDYFTLRYPSERDVSLNAVITDDENIRRFILKQSPETARFHRVLTGVRFARNHMMQLILAARFTAVDITTGRLILDDKWDGWVYPKYQSGTHEIKLEDPDVPTLSSWPNVEVRGLGKYVKFQPTDNTKDFGQTTVPFLDSQDVVGEPPVPLSGAGLYYKGQAGFGGFIGLKLMAFDFSQFVATELTV